MCTTVNYAYIYLTSIKILYYPWVKHVVSKSFNQNCLSCTSISRYHCDNNIPVLSTCHYTFIPYCILSGRKITTIQFLKLSSVMYFKQYMFCRELLSLWFNSRQHRIKFEKCDHLKADLLALTRIIASTYRGWISAFYYLLVLLSSVCHD